MKILIVSDTHGQEKNLEEVLKVELIMLIDLGRSGGRRGFYQHPCEMSRLSG